MKIRDKIYEQNLTEKTKDIIIKCPKCDHVDRVTVPIETNLMQLSIFTQFTHKCTNCNKNFKL